MKNCSWRCDGQRGVTNQSLWFIVAAKVVAISDPDLELRQKQMFQIFQDIFRIFPLSQLHTHPYKTFWTSLVSYIFRILRCKLIYFFSSPPSSIGPLFRVKGDIITTANTTVLEKFRSIFPIRKENPFLGGKCIVSMKYMKVELSGGVLLLTSLWDGIVH